MNPVQMKSPFGEAISDLGALSGRQNIDASPHTSPATGWLKQVLQPVGHIDQGWLRHILPKEALHTLLQRTGAERRHATRLLTEHIQKLGSQPLWGAEVSAPAWLSLEPKTQQTLAIRLGARACQAWLRMQVNPVVVKECMALLEADYYRFILKSGELNIPGLTLPDTQPPQGSQQIGAHLMAWGAAFLELCLGAQSPATRFRLRLVLPPTVWQARPTLETTSDFDVETLTTLVDATMNTSVVR